MFHDLNKESNAESKSFFSKSHIDWMLLSFASGAVNAGGYLACHRFVSHVTGFATLAGTAAARTHWFEALGMLTVPVYFLMGVIVSANLIDRRLHLGLVPHYATVMGLVATLLTAASVAGAVGWFGAFGAAEQLGREYILLALLCAASGLQNAAVTTASHATIRASHLTGITNDLGIGIVRWFSLSRDHSLRQREGKLNSLRLGTIVSFMLGSALGAVMFLRFEYWGFLMPAAVALYGVIVALRERPHVRMARSSDRAA